MESSKNPNSGEGTMAKDLPSKRVSKSTELAKRQAREAYDQGRQVFIFEAGNRFPTEGLAEAIEAIESIGWRLEHVSHASSFARSPGHPIGYYLFRRI
jgi:hypothetical protein